LKPMEMLNSKREVTGWEIFEAVVAAMDVAKKNPNLDPKMVIPASIIMCLFEPRIKGEVARAAEIHKDQYGFLSEVFGDD